MKTNKLKSIFFFFCLSLYVAFLLLLLLSVGSVVDLAARSVIRVQLRQA